MRNPRHNNNNNNANNMTRPFFSLLKWESESERGQKDPAGPEDLLPSFNQQSGNLEKRRLRLHPNPPTHTPLSPLWEAGGGTWRNMEQHVSSMEQLWGSMGDATMGPRRSWRDEVFFLSFYGVACFGTVGSISRWLPVPVNLRVLREGGRREERGG